MCRTHQFVLLQVESLQFTASSSQGHHAFICDTVALTQVDVPQLTAVLSQLKAKGEIIEYKTKNLHLNHFIEVLLNFHLETNKTNEKTNKAAKIEECVSILALNAYLF